MTGSCLGRTLNTEFKLSAGDLSLWIETLDFEEFTEAFGTPTLTKYTASPGPAAAGALSPTRLLKTWKKSGRLSPTWSRPPGTYSGKAMSTGRNITSIRRNGYGKKNGLKNGWKVR